METIRAHISKWDDATAADPSERYFEISAAVEYIKKHIPTDYAQTQVGIVCGSGLSDIGSHIESAINILYSEIPYFPESTVQGHGDRLVVGMLNGVVVLCMLGRFHFYEGHSMWNIAFPIHVMKELGVQSLIITNAAGGIDQSFKAGDIMVIEDHISFLGLCGLSPLRGQNMTHYGPRFPSMSQPYCPKSFECTVSAAEEAGVDSRKIRRGVYVGVGGPSFETRAELKFLSMIGGSAVGMSTTPEVIVAVHAGLRVLGISLITNVTDFTVPLSEAVAPSHEEVLQAAANATNDMVAIVTKMVPKLNEA